VVASPVGQEVGSSGSGSGSRCSDSTHVNPVCTCMCCLSKPASPPPPPAGAKIQMLDLPGIIEGAKDGKGRGRQVISTARTCNLILIVLDCLKPLTHKKVGCDTRWGGGEGCEEFGHIVCRE
jgi:hypothetical protein